MWMKILLTGAAFAGLAACQPAVPDSAAGIPDPGRGVGFDNSVTAIRERDAALARPTIAPVTIDGQQVTSPAGAAGPVSRPLPQTASVSSGPNDDPELARLNAEAAARARAANSGQDVVLSLIHI